ncbi:DUF2141 domain-containing protein [Sphingomonas sp. HF-S3]|uniref:DUF2141 domain-containing protein n=1 Tax=Sphingomonas rustica TaxID=3103142 RepID=A0ABV0BBL8_9SPHN
MFARPLIAALMLATAPIAASAQTAPAAAPSSAAGSTLTLKFEGVKQERGTILIAVYADAASWAGGAPARVAMLPVGQSHEVKVPGLASGHYGIKVFQDLDGDMKLTTNPFGIPIEPYGFSRDAMGAGKSPDWDAASFDFGAADAVQTITLR